MSPRALPALPDPRANTRGTGTALAPLGTLRIETEESALKPAQLNGYDLLIIDSTVVEDVPLLVARIRAHYPDARIIVTTASPTCTASWIGRGPRSAPHTLPPARAATLYARWHDWTLMALLAILAAIASLLVWVGAAARGKFTGEAKS